MEDKIKNLMEKLSITREEAEQVIADDLAIDRGEKLFELTPEQKKVAKKATCATGRNESKPRAKKSKDADEDKLALMAALQEALQGVQVENLEVTNVERQLDFTFNDRKFRVVLSAPRS